MNSEPTHWWQHIHRHDLLALLLLIATSLAACAVLILPISLRPSSLPLRAGQVAPQDLQAPGNVEYISEVRTTQARDASERSVAPVYTAPDQAIARRQISRLRTAIETITSIRGDNAITYEEKRTELSLLPDMGLSTKAVERILALSDLRWAAVQQDALRVLEQIMRSSVREENLAGVQAGAQGMVSFALNEEQASIVVDLTTPFIEVNSFYSLELTDAARLQARQAVEPVTQAYLAGETIVQRGKVLTIADIEALEIIGLVRPSNPVLEYLGTISIVIVMMTFIGFYFHRRRPTFYNDNRSLILIALLFIAFLAAARLIIPNRTLLPYVFPLSAFGLLIATLFGPGGGIILSFAICVLAAFGLPNALDLTVFYLMVSFTGILSLGKAHRISSFAWAATVSAVSGMAVITAYRLPAGNLDAVGFLSLTGAALLNGIASTSVALMLQYLLAEILGLTTGLRLLEISRPDAPLLQ